MAVRSFRTKSATPPLNSISEGRDAHTRDDAIEVGPLRGRDCDTTVGEAVANIIQHAYEGGHVWAIQGSICSAFPMQYAARGAILVMTVAFATLFSQMYSHNRQQRRTPRPRTRFHAFGPPWEEERKNLGYNVTSLDVEPGKLRLIEVKVLADESGTILPTRNERRVAEVRRDCYWPCVVTSCAAKP